MRATWWTPGRTDEELRRRSGDPAAAAGVRLVELADGPGRGVRVLEFRTGSGLTFDVLVDRAMDIGSCEHSGAPVAWRSATGVRNPALHEYDSEEGFSLFRSFTGLLVTAGLDHTLFPYAADAEGYGYPPRTVVRHGLHGRVGHLPARLCGYGAAGSVLWAEGEITQAAVFGEHLVLRRRIEVDRGGEEIRLTDTVTNAGFDPTPHMFLYHVNLGWPLLDEGTTVQVPATGVIWQSDSVEDQGIPADEVSGPLPGLHEQVWEHAVDPEPDGKVALLVSNARIGLRFRLGYDTAQFPHLFQWFHLREGAYGMALEPSTHAVGGEEAARAAGAMTFLAPGEEHRYDTTFTVARFPGPNRPSKGASP